MARQRPTASEVTSSRNSLRRDPAATPVEAPPAYQALSRAEAHALSRCAPLRRPVERPGAAAPATPAEPAEPAKPAVTVGEWAVIAQPDQVAFVRRQVAAFAALAGMQADDGMAELLVAVSEALTNAVVHAYRDCESAGSVVVGAHVQPGELTIRVRDYGQGIAPRTDSPGMGIGLPMIARLAKVSSVRRCEGDGGGTEVSMSFPLVAVAHDARAELAAAHRT